jgi:hypothetical protein
MMTYNSMKYDSIADHGFSQEPRNKSLPIFANANAPDRCRNPEFFLHQAIARAASGGDEYISQCRCPSCSVACNKRYAEKLATCLRRRIEELPADYKAYRGNLMLPKYATPDDHKRVKRAFEQNLRRAKEKHGFDLELFAIRHSTDVHNAHWDISVYSNGPKTVVKSVLLDCWDRAGGSRKSLQLIPRDEYEIWARYQAKAVIGDEDKIKLIPAPRSICPLQSFWSTGGFWGSGTLESYWSDFLDILYPDRVKKRLAHQTSQDSILFIASNDVSQDGSNDSQDATSECPTVESIMLDLTVMGLTRQRFLTLETLEHEPNLTPFLQTVLCRYKALTRNPRRDSLQLIRTLPRKLAEATGIDRLAVRLGWDKSYIKGLLDKLLSVGEVKCSDGACAYNGLYAPNRRASVRRLLT